MADAQKDAGLTLLEREPFPSFEASKPSKALVRAEHVVFLQGENHV